MGKLVVSGAPVKDGLEDPGRRDLCYARSLARKCRDGLLPLEEAIHDLRLYVVHWTRETVGAGPKLRGKRRIYREKMWRALTTAFHKAREGITWLPWETWDTPDEPHLESINEEASLLAPPVPGPEKDYALAPTGNIPCTPRETPSEGKARADGSGRGFSPGMFMVGRSEVRRLVRDVARGWTGARRERPPDASERRKSALDMLRSLQSRPADFLQRAARTVAAEILAAATAFDEAKTMLTRWVDMLWTRHHQLTPLVLATTVADVCRDPRVTNVGAVVAARLPRLLGQDWTESLTKRNRPQTLQEALDMALRRSESVHQPAPTVSPSNQALPERMTAEHCRQALALYREGAAIESIVKTFPNADEAAVRAGLLWAMKEGRR